MCSSLSRALVLVCLCGCGGFERGRATDAAVCAPPEAGPFATVVRPILDAGCRKHHSPSGLAGKTRFVLTGDLVRDHAGVLALLSVTSPESSPLLAKGAGQGHAGGAPLPKGSADYELVRGWIADGALLVEGTPCAPPPDGGQPAPPDAAVHDDGGALRDAGHAPLDAAAPMDAATDAGHVVDAGPMMDGSTPSDAGGDASDDAAVVPSFASDVRPILVDDCKSCHSASGVASATGLLFGASVDWDRASVSPFIDTGDPEQSALLTKTRGESHGGGERFAEGSDQYQTILRWIAGGTPP